MTEEIKGTGKINDQDYENAICPVEWVPCGYEVSPGICSIPGKSGRQPFDCANCGTGTDQNKRAIAKAEKVRK